MAQGHQIKVSKSIYLHYLICSCQLLICFQTHLQCPRPHLISRKSLHTRFVIPNLWHPLQAQSHSCHTHHHYISMRFVSIHTPNQTKIQQQLSGIPPHPLPTLSRYTPQHYAPQLGTPFASFHQPTAFSHPSFTGLPNPFLHPVYFHAQPSPTIVQRPLSNAQQELNYYRLRYSISFIKVCCLPRYQTLPNQHVHLLGLLAHHE